MSLLCSGLMGAAPQGPGDDEGGFDLALRQARSNTADFLYRPADQSRLLRIIVRLLFGGAGVLALRRMAASMAKASMASETCRCQPCQERVSLCRGPTRFWPSRSRPRWPSVGPRPLPGFPFRSRRGTKSSEKGQLAISDSAADKKAPGPQTGQALVVFGRFKIGEFHIGPVEQPLALGSGPGRQATPGGGIERAGDLGRGSGNGRLGAPGVELAGGGDAEYIAFAGPAQSRLNLAHPIDAVADHPGKWHPRRDGPLDHGARKVRLGRKGNLLRDVRCCPARRILGPGLGQIEGPVDK